MKIAVPFENGQVFQHFGHSEQFKLYETENGFVTSSEVISTAASGHDALSALMQENGVNVLVCGGIGAGAQQALMEHGIEICSGAEGDADAAVEAYLRGELVSEGVNCAHHGEDEGCGCGSDEDCGSCGSGCGGCGHHCGGCSRPTITGPNVGKTVRVHYRGTLNDGSQFDSSYDRGEPLEFVCGAGMMILGFDTAVANMEPGAAVDIHLMPEEAYGPLNPEQIFTVEIKQLPGSENLTVGQRVFLTSAWGQPFPVTVTAKDDISITLDANHQMAGKELNFHIELVEIL